MPPEFSHYLYILYYFGYTTVDIEELIDYVIARFNEVSD
jgi:hypothetical protein